MGLLPGSEDSLEEEMATHSRILAWRIPWTEEPGGLQSMGSQELDRTEQVSMHARAHTHTHPTLGGSDLLHMASTTSSLLKTLRTQRHRDQGASGLKRSLSQFSHSVVSNSLRPTDCSMPGFPVLHHLPKFAQIHVHRVGDAIQPSHPLSSPSPPAFSLSPHQGLFQGVSSLHQVAKVLVLQLLHQSFQ